jgi:hypothetical protein
MQDGLPSLPFEAWQATKETLHRYTQIIGKIQLATTPVVNHFWNVPLRVTSRGIATQSLRYGGRAFDIELDFVDHHVLVRTSTGSHVTIELHPQSVADFNEKLFDVLHSLGIKVHIWDQPVELKTEAIPFSRDHVHADYDRAYVERFHRVLSIASAILEEFRARFTGKCSGVGFYWGTFDLAVARYSGRRIPDARMTNAIEREGYSHEVSEVGFWPGDAVYRAPAFYALHYPAPEAFARTIVRPAEAEWSDVCRSFVLPYEACRGHDLRAKVLEFCQSTYEAGATLAGWNRDELERSEPTGGQHAA